MEQLTTQTSVNERGKQNSGENNTELIKRENYGIFQIVTIDEKCFIAIGNKRISEEFIEEDKKELIEMIENKDWNLIIGTIAVVTEQLNKLK